MHTNCFGKREKNGVALKKRSESNAAKRSPKGPQCYAPRRPFFAALWEAFKIHTLRLAVSAALRKNNTLISAIKILKESHFSLAIFVLDF